MRDERAITEVVGLLRSHEGSGQSQGQLALGDRPRMLALCDRADRGPIEVAAAAPPQNPLKFPIFKEILARCSSIFSDACDPYAAQAASRTVESAA